MNLRNHIQLALGYFIMAALLGLLLRSFHTFEIPIDYKFVVHGHSHIALLGWVYMGLTTLLYKLFLDQQGLNRKYRRIFWFTQVTLIGMLVTFPFQGYALLSIIFSTLFLLASYWFAWFFIKNVPVGLKRANSYQCIRFALIYMVLSSIGPWLLGIIMNTLGAGSIWYRLAIYFYLHFQYNGWMVLALIGLFLFVLEQREIIVPKKIFRNFFWSMNFGIVFTFFLSTLWIPPSIVYNILGGLGALFQLMALVLLTKFALGGNFGFKNVFSEFQSKALTLVVVLLFVKMGLQLLTGLPYFAKLASIFLDFTIAYLHLTFLGVITIALFTFLDYFKLLEMGNKTFALFLMGFVLTEGLIFYKGIAAWLGFGIFEGYFEFLAFASLLIFVSLVSLLVPRRLGT
ncbi:hypothetical protein [Maribacter polysaccharolyticus]|uniref:hypothetical protein n=1 Tax=Maribacter polysaccharolyticus TaxID=3020831 RepID=UPI00237FD288|nr:hypothetical protein [Maribacter polysaccharolyticus]MDE3742593.1 hypothetical protein [Maribacter polysaccharolyticus]